MAVANSGWSSADFRPLMELVWPMETGICKTCSASLAMCGTRAPPPQRKTPGAQIIEQPGLLQILRDQLENLLQPQRHDALQMLDVDGLERQAEFVGDGDGLAFDRPRPRSAEPCSSFNFSARLNGTFRP